MSDHPDDDRPMSFDTFRRYGLQHPEDAIIATMTEGEIANRLRDLYARIVHLQRAGDLDDKIAFFDEQATVITKMIEDWAAEEAERSREEADARYTMRQERRALYGR